MSWSVFLCSFEDLCSTSAGLCSCAARGLILSVLCTVCPYCLSHGPRVWGKGEVCTKCANCTRTGMQGEQTAFYLSPHGRFSFSLSLLYLVNEHELVKELAVIICMLDKLETAHGRHASCSVLFRRVLFRPLTPTVTPTFVTAFCISQGSHHRAHVARLLSPGLCTPICHIAGRFDYDLLALTKREDAGA